MISECYHYAFVEKKVNGVNHFVSVKDSVDIDVV